MLFLHLLLFICQPLRPQSGRYWDQNLNSDAALLSGAVVAGESGIAAIFYNPATITEMQKDNLSLSANLASSYYYNAKNALGTDFSPNRLQAYIYPRIVTLTFNPKNQPDLTVELAYFTKTNSYMQINQGTSFTGDIIASNPGNEQYTADYYLRLKYQDFYSGAGFGYKVSENLALGFSGLISYKDDQFYNLVTANAFTTAYQEASPQYVSEASYQIKYNMFDVRLITKLGIQLRHNSWKFGANVNLPSLKIFGNGTVVKQYEYSNIHTDTGNPEASGLYYGGRQKECPAHFKDPLSIAAGANYMTHSGNTVILFTAEYFLGLKSYNYIEANHEPGEEGYNHNPAEPEDWLSFTSVHKPVLNAGVAFKTVISDRMVFSGGFRTDFNYIDPVEDPVFPYYNNNTFYVFDVYHLNSG
ncbi:MAG: hypothetical protein U5L72_12510 [Bacteroidales bacterium]|nr:hypothetical protein [Bacteroidales bacterium]